MRYDIIIVGGGLAGACAALWLSESNSVLVLEANEPGSGATGAAAGLITPFKGLRATSMWRHEEAVDALQATLTKAEVADLFNGSGVFRPALDETQAQAFQKAVAKYPSQISWLERTETSASYPDVNASHGGLWIPSGGSVPLVAFSEAMLGAAEKSGAVLLSGHRLASWDDEREVSRVYTDGGAFEANRLLLCLGAGYSSFSDLTSLPLHKVKGQTIRLERPTSLSKSLPAISGGVYVVPDDDGVVVGSTFEHEFTHLHPQPHISIELRNRATELIPALSNAAILEERAGVRVTVPKIRLPLLGPLPGSRRVWVFTALGAKGLMTAPLLARKLPAYLNNPETLPLEVLPPN